ncbi:MAG: hypothetical protein MI723_07195 [Caulobacterales bacterium]|nr:hypothetical protein [Caulobacterales bacterium]
MTEPSPNAAAMVRVLYAAIAFMTLAIIFILGAFVGRLLSPSAPRLADAVDFTDPAEVSLALPAGARVLETQIGADRVTLHVETAGGERVVYTAPLASYGQPTRLVFRPAP